MASKPLPRSPRSRRRGPESSMKEDEPITPRTTDVNSAAPKLHDLAAYARARDADTFVARLRSQGGTILCIGAITALAATAANASLLSLSPVYGSYAAATYHGGLVTACLFLGWSCNVRLARLLAHWRPVTSTGGTTIITMSHALPVLAALMSVTAYHVYIWSDVLGARYGPIVTEAVTLAPLLIASTACVADHLDGLDLGLLARTGGRMAWATDAAPGVATYVLWKVAEQKTWSVMMSLMGRSWVFTRVGWQLLLAMGQLVIFILGRWKPRTRPGASSLLSRASLYMLVLVIFGLLHTFFINVHLPLAHLDARVNATLHGHGWSLLERAESLTGYISIMENHENYKVMRCDHSLLGGSWLPPPAHMSSGHGHQVVADPIYGVFVMLEAVRLVARDRDRVSVSRSDHDEKALVIGLGIGTTPGALMAHGIQTTIVEIDPVVVDFARRHFALPEPEHLFVQDAISYASGAVARGEQYDYIIHDVFTGGAEPVNLFTYEFLQDLQALLKPGGVIAINYAGDILLPPFHITLSTIHAIFGAPHCRIFRESAAPSAAKLAADKQDFTNGVIFCLHVDPSSQPQHPASVTTTPSHLRFRKPTREDLLGSASRRAFLEPKHEITEAEWRHARTELATTKNKAQEEGERGERNAHVDSGPIRPLFRNETARLHEWQVESARGHWALMRGVVGREVWEAW